MMRVCTLLLWGALLLGPAAPASANGSPEDDAACVRTAVDAIQRRYREVRDLRSGFVQTTRSVALGAAGALSVSRGTVVFAKPGKMRWSYEEPEPSLVVSDGSWLWIYDPVNREAQRARVGAGYLSGAAIQFLLGEGDIQRDFEVTAESCAEGSISLELHPRRPASYEKLRVVTDPATGDLRETTVVDLLGNVTKVAFQDMRANLDPPADVFTFDPPPGVTVIDLEPATPGEDP